MEVKYSDLKYGLMIRNKRSGSIGEVYSYPTEPGWEFSEQFWVVVRIKIPSKKRKAGYSYAYPCWRSRNIEHVQ